MKYFRENMSQRAIAKEVKIDRITVRKYKKYMRLKVKNPAAAGIIQG